MPLAGDLTAKLKQAIQNLGLPNLGGGNPDVNQALQNAYTQYTQPIVYPTQVPNYTGGQKLFNNNLNFVGTSF
jgi:hypothetical protein